MKQVFSFKCLHLILLRSPRQQNLVVSSVEIQTLKSSMKKLDQINQNINAFAS